jgi:Tol biopolymer transport system component
VHFGVNRAHRLALLTGLAGLVLAGTVGAQGASATGDAPAKTTLLVKGAGNDALGGQVGLGAISATGRYVAYVRAVVHQVDGYRRADSEVFVLDRSSGRSQLASVSNSGAMADNGGEDPAISADGRFVAFGSDASNLAAGSPTAVNNIYVRDMQAKRTQLVSVGVQGGSGDRDSRDPSISADGRRIAFDSIAHNLVPGLDRGFSEVHVRNLDAHTTIPASGSSQKSPGHSHSDEPVISGNGRFVTFESRSKDLAPGDQSHDIDVFVRDLQTGTVRWVSNVRHVTATSAAFPGSISADGRFITYFTLSGTFADARSGLYVWDANTGKSRLVSAPPGDQADHSFNLESTISADGRFVAFSSTASYVALGNTHGQSNIFLADLNAGTTRLASISTHGTEANGESGAPVLSADGRVLLFTSNATNLVPGDKAGVTDIFVREPLR